MFVYPEMTEEKKIDVGRMIAEKYPKLSLNEKTGAVKLGRGYRWYDQVNDQFFTFEEVEAMPEKKQKELKSSCFIQLSIATIEFLRELFASQSDGRSLDKTTYLSTEAQSAWATSSRQSDVLQRAPEPHLKTLAAKYFAKGVGVGKHEASSWAFYDRAMQNVVCNHSPPTLPKMRIITPEYFDFTWSEKFSDIVRGYEWMNPLEWIRVDERYGMLCTGIFKRFAKANRIYNHGHKASDNHFLCVMDHFLSPEECQLLLSTTATKSVEGFSAKIKKITTPFMTNADVVVKTEKEEKKEGKKEGKIRERAKVTPRKEITKTTTHLIIFLGPNDGRREENLVFDSFGATIEPRCGRAIWWRFDEMKCDPVFDISTNSLWHAEVK